MGTCLPLDNAAGLRCGGGISSAVGTGVVAAVVFNVAVATGPTYRSQRSSQAITVEKEIAVGFMILRPAEFGKGAVADVLEVRFGDTSWHTTKHAPNKRERAQSVILTG